MSQDIDDLRGVGVVRVKRALESRGLTLARMAEVMGIKRQSSYNWTDIPLEWVRFVSRYTGVKPSLIRPDLARIIDLSGLVDDIDEAILMMSDATYETMPPVRRRDCAGIPGPTGIGFDYSQPDVNNLGGGKNDSDLEALV